MSKTKKRRPKAGVISLRQTIRMGSWPTCCVNAYDVGQVVCRGCGRDVR